MSKKFFDVFPTLQVDKIVRTLMENTVVERVTSNRTKDLLRVYFSSDHLLQKEQLWDLERMIKKQLFPAGNMEIKLQERFHLSEQYSLSNLIAEYKKSILAELEQYNHILHSMFKNAVITYPAQNKMELQVKDMVLYRDRQEELLRILEKVLVERCGKSAILSVEYLPMEEGDSKREDEVLIQRKVAEISRKAMGAEAERDTASLDNKEEVKSAANEKKAEDKKEKTFDKKEEEKPAYRRPQKKSDNPDVIYGRDFEEEAIPISDIIGEIGEVTIRGKIISTDKREIRNEKTILFFDLTDFTDTMTIKVFTRNDQLEELLAEIKKDAFVKLKGMAMIDKFDGELTIGSITGIKKIKDFTTKRQDLSLKKRVELHCHTKMSDMDGVSEAKAIVKRAYSWGHPAIAITDHGVVQSFPEANHVWEDLWKAEKSKRKEAGEQEPDKNDFFKIIYGVEAYIVDDSKQIATNERGQGLDDSYVVFDIETTGFSPVKNRIIEIGAVKVRNKEIVDRFSVFVNPKVPIPYEITRLTGIQDSMVVEAETIEEVLPKFLEFARDCVLVAHNANFDMSFIQENCRRQKYPTEYTYVDTLALARVLLPSQGKHTLDAVCKTLKISLENHHRAVDDAEATAQMFLRFLTMLEEQQVTTLEQVNEIGEESFSAVSKLPYYHAILLAKNNTGRVNMYTLVSESHLT
ncbi:MAG: PHP domain-containing protein, partial [Lachnospiraceae bacterium]|nr:PHP domain-containing protein [Lachnospiraceae bacterium]